MRPLDLAVKTHREARQTHDVHADWQVAFGEGFLDVMQHAGFFMHIRYEIEITICGLLGFAVGGFLSWPFINPVFKFSGSTYLPIIQLISYCRLWHLKPTIRVG